VRRGNRQHTYALKSAETTNGDASGKSKWEVEVTANLHIRNQHPNILPLLHSHTHGSHYNMIFPFADCNLREFYQREPSPPTAEHRFHFVEQISRLVPALAAIHRTDMDMDSPGPRLVGYHRDLKPDNILVFEKAHKFVISDLGLAEFKPYKDHQENSGVPWLFGVSSYRAPECSDKGRMVGRGGDIWSLGCILAEAITWCVLGKNGVKEFSNARSTVLDMGDHGKYPQDWFFQKLTLSNGREAMQLKPQVRNWFEKLRQASDNDLLICDVLKIIESMLKENPRGAKGRPTAEKIDCEFYSALRSAAQRLGITLDIKKPPYYARHEKDETSVNNLRRQSIPYTYLNTSLKRPRSTERGINSFINPPATVVTDSTVPVVSSATSLSTVRRPSKRRRDVSPFAHLRRLDTVCVSPVNATSCLLLPL
jgi:serine/threonine protein kinase